MMPRLGLQSCLFAGQKPARDMVHCRHRLCTASFVHRLARKTFWHRGRVLPIQKAGHRRPWGAKRTVRTVTRRTNTACLRPELRLAACLCSISLSLSAPRRSPSFLGPRRRNTHFLTGLWRRRQKAESKAKQIGGCPSLIPHAAGGGGGGASSPPPGCSGARQQYHRCPLRTLELFHDYPNPAPPKPLLRT
jgi:hypothetical protein